MGVESLLNPASAIGSAVLGGVQLFTNLAKEKKARAELASLKDPFYKIRDEYIENKNLAQGLAQNGLPTASKDYYTGELSRGLGTGVSGTILSGGNSNDIAKLFSIYDKGIDRTAAEDAEAKIKNIQYFQNVNKDYAGQKNIQFGFNEVRPYERNYKRLTQEKAAATQNAWNGANQIIGSTAALGTSLSNNKLLDSLFAEPTQPIDRGGTTSGVPLMQTTQPLNTTTLSPFTPPTYTGWNGIPYPNG